MQLPDPWQLLLSFLHKEIRGETMRENDSAVRKRLADNSGFTLVELILTIAILAVVSIPILSYFTDSAKHNAESRKKQNATVEAQDVLEKFKNASYSLDDENVVCSADPSWTVSTHQTAAGEKYVLSKEETVDRTSFSVTAEIDPLPSTAPVAYKDYVIGTMDTTKDVIVSEHGQALLNAEAAFYGKYKAGVTAANPSATLAPALSNMAKFKNLLDCEVTVSAEIDPANASNLIIRATYKYTYNGGGGLGALPGINAGVSPEYTYSEEVEASSVPAKELENIYLFYTPLNSSDKINFVFRKNKSNQNINTAEFAANVKDVNLYIVAQDSLDDSGAVVSGIPGSTYRLQVVCDTGATVFGEAISKVYTNFEDTNTIDESASFVAGKVEYSLVHGDSINRLADITVTVTKDSKQYAQVSGTKIQD
jgi:prepilin-type N-terminal cleavage/methylation domain-containing protein